MQEEFAGRSENIIISSSSSGIRNAGLGIALTVLHHLLTERESTHITKNVHILNIQFFISIFWSTGSICKGQYSFLFNIPLFIVPRHLQLDYCQPKAKKTNPLELRHTVVSKFTI